MTRMEIVSQLIIENEFHTNSVFHGVEVGVLRGEFSRFLLKQFGNLYMVGVDPCPLWDFLYSNCKEFEDRFRLIRMNSDEAIRYLDRVYDFVFIDADHSYHQTRKDILNYWQIIKKGGILCGHNYDGKSPKDAHPGVKQAVDEIFDNRVKVNFDDFTWWIKV